jgi:hypothetical protein
MTTPIAASGIYIPRGQSSYGEKIRNGLAIDSGKLNAEISGQSGSEVD